MFGAVAGPTLVTDDRRRLAEDDAAWHRTDDARRAASREGIRMTQIVYSMRFSGQAVPAEGSSNVLKAATEAPSCTITSLAGPDGLSSSIEPTAGGTATFESEVMFTGDAAFQERGTITFGTDGHRLQFSTVGQGYLGASADPTLKHGTVMWQVDGGEGQFEGATGLITSNFTVGEAGEVVDHHFGLLHLP